MIAYIIIYLHWINFIIIFQNELYQIAKADIPTFKTFASPISPFSHEFQTGRPGRKETAFSEHPAGPDSGRAFPAPNPEREKHTRKRDSKLTRKKEIHEQKSTWKFIKDVEWG